MLSAVCLLHALLSWSGHVVIDVNYTSPDTAIYPGTTRTFQVYVPDQYDGKTPACLYVGLDGILCRAPQVMDSLIAEGKMPITIGVFIQPGVISDDNGNVIRYNRSNEFDMTDATFARFLETQLLPQVLGLSTPDGRPVRLSSQGSDRMIFGLSSGGIAAFTAAWHRPDLFGRVFSGVGTFVAMRGGNDLQAIVRKHEPKPLRIFLQDGSNDVWNPLFGHWFEGNRMLASALEFAGYDILCDWSDGGHNVVRATQIFAQVMEWMWHDWPEPLKVGKTNNDFLSSVLIPGETWQPSSPQGVVLNELVAFYPDSSLLVKHVPSFNCLRQVAYNKQTRKELHEQPFYWLHSYDNAPIDVGGMAFDGDGNLWVITSAGLQVCDQNGRVRAIIELPLMLRADIIKLRVAIANGEVTLVGQTSAYKRRFNVKPPLPGLRPKSQGQG